MRRMILGNRLAIMLASIVLFSWTSADLAATETAEGGHRLAWRETGTSLALLNGDTIVWQFNHLQDGTEKGCPYFHPLGTMDGAVLTDLRPEDHLWHRGLRFAWKKIDDLEGYWTWPDGQQRWPDQAMGHTDVVAVKVIRGNNHSARFELELRYHPPEKPAVLVEKRTLVVSAPAADGSYQIDWRGDFTPCGKAVLLDRTPLLGEEGGKAWGGYAGMQLRVTHRKNIASWAILNSEGVSIEHEADAERAALKKSLERAHGKKARWMHLALDLADGKTGGITLFDHPDNLRFPAPWHVSSMPNELICSPLFTSPYLLDAEKTLTFQFQILIHPGRMKRTPLENQWKEFSYLEHIK